MPEKSLYQKISNPIETYIDGYGQTREVYEPKYVGDLRKAYNAVNRFLKGPSEEEYKAMGFEKPVGEDLGILDYLGIGGPQKAVIMAFSPRDKKWIEISKRAAQLQEGNTAKYSLYKAIGKNEKLPSKIASRKANLVERGITETGEPYVIRKNEFANPSDVEWLNYRKSGALEDYSGPAEWANTGKGSQVVKGHKQGGILKRK